MKSPELDTTQNIVSPGPEMSCQEKLSSDVSAMGNTKSFNNTDKQNSQEILIDTVNENIKKVCSNPDYKSNEKCQLIIQKVLNIVVDATNENELCENIKNQNLQIFINPLKESDIKQLCQSVVAEKQGDANIEIISSVSVLQETSNNNTTEETPNKKLWSVVLENVRILKKSPSYSHDQISQMSVKLVSEILEKANTEEEISKSLKQFNLEYFSIEDKSVFWSQREESMSRLIMDTLAEDEEQEELSEEDLTESKKLQKEEVKEIKNVEIIDHMQSQKENILETSEPFKKEVEEVKDDDKKDENDSNKTQYLASNPCNADSFTEHVEVEVNEIKIVIKESERNSSSTIKNENTISKSGSEILDSIEKKEQTLEGNVKIEDVNNIPLAVKEKVETEKSNLITTINKNISKICKEEDYNKNETAQRKVRTLFNIITESETAEEIYDKIELEGLQYFAELVPQEKETSVQRLSRSPSVLETKDEPQNKGDSIVSKILSEINTPKLQKRELEKSKTAGDISFKKEVTICTLTRNKASRRVKKFKTSKSTTSIDKIGISSSESNSRSSESEAHSSAEALKIKSKSPSTLPCPLEENTPSLEITDEIKERLTPQINVQYEDILEPEQTESNIECKSLKTLDQETEAQESNDDEFLDSKSLSINSNDEEKYREAEREPESVNLSLTPEMIERKQQSVKAQKNFSEALRDSKHRREHKKKKITIDKNSIVFRILDEKRKTETKDDVLSDKKEEYASPKETRREKTISVCSDNIPDLEECKEGDETPEVELIDNSSEDERNDDLEDLDEELPSNLSKKSLYKSGSLFFMTDFDDEEEEIEINKNEVSEDESFADANEHLSHDEMGRVKPLIKEVLTSTLKESFCDTKDNNLNIDRLSTNLLSPLTILVKTMVDDKLTSGSSKGHSPLCSDADKIIENQTINTVSIVDDPASKIDYECENDADAFDMSMKRLDFIETSFKTINSDESTSVPAIQHVQDPVKDRLERIRKIMASVMDKEDKLIQIDSILMEGSDIEDREQTKS